MYMFKLREQISVWLNFFLGSISYITKALAVVLQLAVTMDYSIFLWHSYEEKQNMRIVWH